MSSDPPPVGTPPAGSSSSASAGFLGFASPFAPLYIAGAVVLSAISSYFAFLPER